MELKIIENKKNEALKRVDIIAEVVEKLIPSRGEIRKKFSAQLNIPIERIIVRQIANEFGQNKSIITAKIYDNLADVKITERDYMVKRNPVKEIAKLEASEKTAKAVNDVETESNDVAEQAVEITKKEDIVVADAVEEAKKEEPTTDAKKDGE